MNAAEIHVLINHLPAFGSIFAAGLFLIGVIKKNITLLNYGYISLFIIALMTVLTFFTGEGAAQKVKDYPEINIRNIEKHEEASKLALIAMAAAGAMSLPGMLLIKFRKKSPRVIDWITFVLAIAAVALLIRTGYYGGNIRKPEGSKPVHFNIDARQTNK